MCLVSTTKSLIQKSRYCGWNPFLEKVISFRTKQAFQIPIMNGVYFDIIQSHRHKDSEIVEHHHRVDIFTVVIDY